ncbi:hypothetical protein D3C86_851540 [compost metagenome]
MPEGSVNSFLAPANFLNPLSLISGFNIGCGQSPIPCTGSCNVVVCGRGDRYLFSKICVTLSLKWPDKSTVSIFLLAQSVLFKSSAGFANPSRAFTSKHSGNQYLNIPLFNWTKTLRLPNSSVTWAFILPPATKVDLNTF